MDTEIVDQIQLPDLRDLAAGQPDFLAGPGPVARVHDLTSRVGVAFQAGTSHCGPAVQIAVNQFAVVRVRSRAGDVGPRFLTRRRFAQDMGEHHARKEQGTGQNTSDLKPHSVLSGIYLVRQAAPASPAPTWDLLAWMREQRRRLQEFFCGSWPDSVPSA
jgi:hypothetical protein